jgi:hypothetical protein
VLYRDTQLLLQKVYTGKNKRKIIFIQIKYIDFRDYNEDRVAIIFNISKPSSFIETPDYPWPKCSFFGLYDGHGGVGCADFLRDNLHKFVK